MFNLPTRMPEEVTKVSVERILTDATPEEVLELQEFIALGSAAKIAALEVPHPLSTSPTASLENAEDVGAVADFLRIFQLTLEQAGFPTLLKKLLLQPLDPERWADVADVMQWQENSEAVYHRRKDEQ